MGPRSRRVQEDEQGLSTIPLNLSVPPRLCGSRSRTIKIPLPTIAGVRPSSQWLPIGNWKTVLEFLKDQFPQIEVETWTRRMAAGEVVDEKGNRLHPNSPYRVGACIFYYREVPNEVLIPFAEQVLYQDEHIIVADKPHFLPVIPSGNFLHETLLVRLRKKQNADELTPIHRLDRETAGVVLFAINAETRGQYTSLFRERQVAKVYEALAPTSDHSDFTTTRRSRIVRGEPFFRMREVDGVANSETHVEQLSSREGNSLYRLVPITGRKHQLRVHMAALQIPILNDRLYPNLSTPAEDDFTNPLKLVARSLSFRDPLTGRDHYFESRVEL